MEIFKHLRQENKWGSAFDRGCADAYLNRQPRPHKIVSYFGYDQSYEERLTEREIEEYMIGYNFEPERKKKKHLLGIEPT